MNVRYMIVLLLATMNLLGSEKYSFTTHMDTIISQGEFLLCTNSGHFGVDCGIFSIQNNKPVLMLSAHVKNENFKSFTDMITDFLAAVKINYNIAVHYACFAGPGVPSAQQDYLEHWKLPYVIDAKEIIAKIGLTSAIVVNDFLAMSYGVDFLDSTKITTLYDAPAEKHGTRAIIGAGSGLGTVSMIWNDHQQSYDSLPSEAGTGDFPALDEFELDLSLRMRKARNFKTVHWAFFVAQPGIQYTYQILQDMNYENYTSNKKYADAMAILADVTHDACCAKTADLFYKFYARFVYNFVWTTLPFGGIYLVGETATMHPEMLSDIFLPEYFNCVESKRPLLKRIPIYIIKDDTTVGLYGTAHYFLKEKKDMVATNSFFGGLQHKARCLWNTLKSKFFACC